MDDIQREIGDRVAAAVLVAIDAKPPGERDQLTSAMKAGDVKVRKDGNKRVVVVGGVDVYRFELGQRMDLDDAKGVN